MLSAITEKKEKLAYSVDEAAAQTSLSKSHLRNEIRAGNLKVRKIGRRILVLNEDLQAYLRQGDDEK